VAEILKEGGAKKGQAKPLTPVWAGPESDASNGGITFSLLSKFLVCRERFRLFVVEGLQSDKGFNHRLEYGNLWHLCEENHARGMAWEGPLKDYCQSLCRQYPMNQEDILKWYNVCRVQFPVYVAYWLKHKDVTERKPLLQEKPFHVPYKLPSGRTVYLRGKWDSVDLLGKSGSGGVYLKENKTKGDIVEQQLRRQLTFDLQTMLYLVALRTWVQMEDNPESDPKEFDRPVCGVIYNVVRRPLSGGKGNIRPHQATKNKPAEGMDDYYKRLQGIIEEEPAYWFMRWRVEVSAHDVQVFRLQCLDPLLEQLCDWWQVIQYTNGKAPWVFFEQGESTGPMIPDDVSMSDCLNQGFMPYTKKHARMTMNLHFRFPYGVYSPLIDGAPTDIDEYLYTGSEVGLRRTTNLFPELQDG